MDKCKKIQDMFEESFMDGLEGKQKQLFEEHLKGCLSCRSGYNEMISMLDFMKKKVPPEPGKNFWESYYDRLQDRMENEGFFKKGASGRKKFSFPVLDIVPRWVYQVAVAMVLLIVGVFLGREIFPPSGTPGQIKKSNVIASKFKLEPELVSLTNDYIEGSKLILLGIVNFDPQTEDVQVLNLPYQQKISKELVKKAGQIKKELAGKRMRRLEELVSDLEVILLQIANLEAGFDSNTIEMVKDGVKTRGVLFKIQLMDMRGSLGKKNKSKKQISL